MPTIRVMVVFVVALWTGRAVAQQSGDIAYFELLHIKPGMEAQFEATLKRHWEWHTKRGETWSYSVWTVESGENGGAYRVASFGHTWKEVDTSNTAVAATPDPGTDTDPFKSSSESSYYVFRPDLSTVAGSPQPASLASFLQVAVKPEAVREFENGLKKIYEALKSNNHGSANAIRCYELATGGDWPQFVIMEDRENWAGFGGEGILVAVTRSVRAKRLDPQLADMFLKSVRSIHTEALQHRPDLSRVVASR